MQKTTIDNEIVYFEYQEWWDYSTKEKPKPNLWNNFLRIKLNDQNTIAENMEFTD